MRKVMLVEDEDFILQGLENIIDWEELDLSIIHKAHNGQEALNMQEEERADIIVTDVCMPLMDGLQLLEKVRETDPEARFIILTGYNEFEYARAAIRMDVEDYILKPIDEEELIKALKNCVLRLQKIEAQRTEQIDEKVEFLHFLEGGMDGDARRRYLEENGIRLSAKSASAAVVRVDLTTLGEYRITEVLRYLGARKVDGDVTVRHLGGNDILLLLCLNEKLPQRMEWFWNLQNELEIDLGVRTFFTVSEEFTQLEGLPEVYRTVQKMQRYLLIDGYGSCVDEAHLKNRTSEDAVIDREKFVRLVVSKDIGAARQYVEDLFINNMKKDASVDVLYQIAVRIALILQEIRSEYNLTGEGRGLSDVIDGIYQAEDLFSVKALFLSEITDIISWLNTENAQYTPVVRQIMAEVKKNFRNDMNLKTLAYKYHMNTSYLGQIFQKEVGCPFSQYLNNVRNDVAKRLILTTNMRINDVAKEVGYSDTSYFYRKFKQSYGVSPPAMREMKQY